MAYNANSIKIKDFRQACRDTPAMYLGDDRQNGIFNCFLEILNNSCDEAIMGRGDEIKIELTDNSITVSDKGAGIPYGPNENCEEVLIELFTKSHTSGKFDNDNYTKVRGLHGVGSSAVCVCSNVFEVTTKRDGKQHFLQFKEGIPQSEKAICQGETEERGTKITFVPNKEVFHLAADEESFDYERIRNELELTSYFIPNVKFILTYNGKTETFFSKISLNQE